MISTSNISLRFGKKALFEDVNIKFVPGHCYGLIGANGAGKSTFLKILTGEIEPTSGEVIITPGERLSFLKQDHFQYDEYTVLDTVIMGNARLYEIMKEKDAMPYIPSNSNETSTPSTINKIGIAVDFIPTDKPLIIFVADPVSELSAISFTLLYFSDVYISVILPIAVPTTKPASTAKNALNSPNNV